MGSAGNGAWAEISFVAGFFINPCTPGTYIWGPNTLTVEGGFVFTTEAREEHTDQVTLADCAVGGVVTPTNKLSIITPYLALAGLVAAVSTVVIVRRRREA